MKYTSERRFLGDDELFSSSERAVGENRRQQQTDHQIRQGTTGHPRRKVSESHEHFRYTAGAKLGSYNGSSCLETFLARFDNCARYFRWDAEDKLFQLTASLEGPAGQILWDTGKHSSVEQVMQLLRSRCGNIN